MSTGFPRPAGEILGEALGAPPPPSPLEEAMYEALVAVRSEVRRTTNVDFALYREASIGMYRVDFLLRFTGLEDGIVVECDGYAFHYENRNQIRADRKRDRFLTSEGLRVLRFLSDEIEKDAHRCAAAVVQVARKLMARGR